MAEQSYSFATGLVAFKSDGTVNGLDVSGANSAITAPVGSSFKVTGIRIHCQTAIAATQAAITITKRVIPGSDTSAVTIGTFTLLATYIAGDVILLGGTTSTTVPNVASSTLLELNPGDSIKFAAAGGGTGTVWPVVLGYYYNNAPSAQTSFSSTTKTPLAGVGTYKFLACTTLS